LKHKKVILYAPTYRDHELENFNLKLDLDKMYEALCEDYVLILKLHPAIRNKAEYEDLYPGFVYDYTGKASTNELLMVTDILISDYSSIPFEFSLLNKPMVFFAYDLDEYTKERGLWESYDMLVPGPVVKETNGLVETIKHDNFDLQIVKDFSSKWNRYSSGEACKNLVSYIFDEKTSLYEEERTAL
jgi:teichoic acid glycerol-phosphate primase